MNRKRLDFAVVVFLLVFGAYLGLEFKPGNIVLGFLYLGIPSFYLLWRKKENYQKILWGLLILGAIFGSVFDFVGTVNHAWTVKRIVMPMWVISGWPLENVIGYLWMTLFILVFYEHFLNKHNHLRLSKTHSRLFVTSLIILGLIFSLNFFSPESLKFSHFYLITGLLAVSFPIIFSAYNPKIIGRFTTLAFFFFFVWLLLEMVGVKNQNWLFPSSGEFIGSVSLLGSNFPFEEVLFWFMWYPAVVVSYYEYFIDDRK